MENLTQGCADQYPLHGIYIFKNLSTNEGIVVCDHDFDPVIEVHEPEPDGWKGFALEYHCNDPWSDDVPWEIVDLDDLVRLLSQEIEKVKESYFNASKCYKLISFLENARSKKESISILKDWGGL